MSFKLKRISNPQQSKDLIVSAMYDDSLGKYAYKNYRINAGPLGWDVFIIVSAELKLLKKFTRFRDARNWLKNHVS